MAEPNFENRTLYHRDNLAVLRGMNSNSVHLIATDPPFNKSRDFHATPDSLAAGASFQDRWSWIEDIHDEWLIEIQRDHPEVWSVITSTKEVYGDDMAAFLCWMGVRLLEMHRVLREDGSMYLHCDHTASHYLKALMDAIFGRRNFRSEIIWRRTTAHNDSTRYGANTDTILFYSKGDKWTWNRQYQPYDEKYKARFRNKDADGRAWSDYDITAKGLTGGGYEYEYKGVTSLWRVPLETMKRLDDEGRLHFTNRGGIRRKRYLDEMPGRPVQSLWEDIDPVNSQARERLGYPTQKPLALYERIINASSNEGDIVIDPFCGCATTPIAAERLGRQWVGIDIWDGAIEVVRQRMEDNRQLLGDIPVIHFTSESPTRTDNAEPAVLELQIPRGRQRYPRPRSQHGRLVTDIGAYCQGCGRDYGFDPRVLEVDHIRPKADGGSDAYDNLTLLCPPCNREKRDRYTLSHLQVINRREGHLEPDNERNIRHGAAPRARRRRRR